MVTDVTDDEAAKAAEAEAAKEAAALQRAAEVTCASDGHPWALPEKNPFNDGSLLSSSATCKRCGASATVTIRVAAKS